MSSNPHPTEAAPERPSFRRVLFGRLIFNLAAVLGAAQLLVWHWATVVVAGRPSPDLVTALGVGGILVLGNALLVPALLGARRRERGDPIARAARSYMELGVATLLLALAVAVSWAGFVLIAGLLGALGAGEAAYAVFRGLSMGLVGTTFAATLWGFTGGQARVARTRVRVELPGLDPVLGGLRIVQISDLHIGNEMDGALLDRMVARTNEANPDVLVITGDIFDRDPRWLEEGARSLAGLRARAGVYAILGNHDAYVGADRVAEALARWAPEIRVLRDEIVRLPVAAPLHLAGVEDPGRVWFDRGLRYAALDAVAAQRPADGPTLLLVHQPEAFEHAADLGFPLVLAGHTHGGQIALPTPRGQFNLSRLVTPLTRGLYHRGASVLYVNRGLGVGGPKLRIHCPREIACIELASAPQARAQRAGGERSRKVERSGAPAAPGPQ